MSSKMHMYNMVKIDTLVFVSCLNYLGSDRVKRATQFLWYCVVCSNVDIFYFSF